MRSSQHPSWGWGMLLASFGIGALIGTAAIIVLTLIDDLLRLF